MNLTDPQYIDSLCDHVSMGGSPIDWCVACNIRYCDLIAWLSDRPADNDRYNTAIIARGEWMVQRVLVELQRVGVSDIRAVFDERGVLRNLVDLPPHVAAAVASVETREEINDNGEPVAVVRKIKFWDKLKALELVGKNLLMFVERVDYRLKGDLNIVINVKQPEINSDDVSSPCAGIHGLRTPLAEIN